MTTCVLQDARCRRAGTSVHGFFDRAAVAFTLVLGLFVVAGCGGRNDSGTTIDTLPGGAVLVRNAGEGMWKRGDGWRLVEAARIGNADGEGPAGFARITALEADQLGRIYVLEGQAQQLRVFDSSGTHI
ncbi:MAG: hypothetical protein ACREU4_08805, partial [Burkholderiales bacterium]